MTSRVQGKLELAFHARQERDLKHAARRGLRFDAAAGERVVTFVERYCKHHKGEFAGKQFKLEQWQKDIVTTAFGWLRADGTRRFRTLYVAVARKNGKSELAAALGLYLLLGDGEAGAEVYSSATKKEQARIVWKAADQMVKASPQLKRFVTQFQNSLVVERNASTFQPLSAESNTLDGLNPHGNIIDELHAHRDRGVWDVLDSAMGARRQPMTIAITTAGVFDKEGIGWEMHDYASKVLDGVFEDDSFCAFIAAPDEGDDDFSEVAHQKANPNLGVSIQPDYLAKQAEKAQRQPGFLNEYLVKHLNKWTQQAKRWLPMDKWAACEPELSPTENARKVALAREDELSGLVCHGGLDLSSKLDLTALVLEFKRGDTIELVCRFWLPEARVLEASKKGQRFYATWEREGWLTTTPGDVIDYEFIRAEVNALAKKFVIRELSYDPWGALDLATRLTGDGVQMVECRQGFRSLSEPTKDLEALVVQSKVKHMRNPILRWCASNAVVVSDPAGNIKPDKAKASERIDGIVALVMARSRAIVAVDDNAENPYTERGFLSL